MTTPSSSSKLRALNTMSPASLMTLVEKASKGTLMDPIVDVNSQDVGTASWSAVGGTEAASIKESGVDKHHDAEALVLSLSQEVRLRERGLSGPVMTIVQSLLRPFIGKYVGRKGRDCDVKEQGRIISAACTMARNIAEHENEKNDEQTYVKYWLDLYLFQVFDSVSDPPKREQWIDRPLFVGWLRRGMLRALAKKDAQFVYSLQKGSKQAWAVLGEFKKRKAYSNHQERLRESRGPVPDDLYLQISRVSREVFRDLKIEDMTKMVPSGSACIQRRRKDGGALSLFDPLDLPWASQEAAAIGKLRALSKSVDEWRQKAFDISVHSVLPRLTRSNLDALCVQVQAIAEPGKYRIITKGDGFLYTALQPLQGSMLKSWKNSKYSTMKDEDLTSRVRSMDKQCKECDFWCSVDYEAATDLLKRDATFAAFDVEPIVQHYLYALGRASMIHNDLSYPEPPSFLKAYFQWQDENPRTKVTKEVLDRIAKSTGWDGKPFHQRMEDAQLMGHPLSFPILCVVNLGVLRTALRRWVDDARWCACVPFGGMKELKRRIRISKRIRDNVIVNGDDMLFKCPLDFVKYFDKAAAEAGFKLSAGKNYVSPHTALINSQLFKRCGLAGMRRVGYLNQRLLTGNNVKTGESMATPAGISRDLNKMFAQVPYAHAFLPMAMRRFRFFRNERFQPNWFLPLHLGGLGIDPRWALPGTKITRNQRIAAAKFIRNPQTLFYIKGAPILPTKQVKGAVVNFRPQFSDYVPGPGEIEDCCDPWLERIALASRLSSKKIDFDGEVTSRRILLFEEKQHGRRRKISPLPFLDLFLLWHARWFGSPGPECPPLSRLVGPPVTPSETAHLRMYLGYRSHTY